MSVINMKMCVRSQLMTSSAKLSKNNPKNRDLKSKSRVTLTL